MMEKTATLNLRVNPEIKQAAEEVLGKLGMPMSTAIDVYLNQIVLTGGIPFKIALPENRAKAAPDIQDRSDDDDLPDELLFEKAYEEHEGRRGAYVRPEPGSSGKKLLKPAANEKPAEDDDGDMFFMNDDDFPPAENHSRDKVIKIGDTGREAVIGKGMIAFEEGSVSDLHYDSEYLLIYLQKVMHRRDIIWGSDTLDGDEIFCYAFPNSVSGKQNEMVWFRVTDHNIVTEEDNKKWAIATYDPEISNAGKKIIDEMYNRFFSAQ